MKNVFWIFGLLFFTTACTTDRNEPQPQEEIKVVPAINGAIVDSIARKVIAETVDTFPDEVIFFVIEKVYKKVIRLSGATHKWNIQAVVDLTTEVLLEAGLPAKLQKRFITNLFDGPNWRDKVEMLSPMNDSEHFQFMWNDDLYMTHKPLFFRTEGFERGRILTRFADKTLKENKFKYVVRLAEGELVAFYSSFFSFEGPQILVAQKRILTFVKNATPSQILEKDILSHLYVHKLIGTENYELEKYIFSKFYNQPSWLRRKGVIFLQGYCNSDFANERIKDLEAGRGREFCPSCFEK